MSQNIWEVPDWENMMNFAVQLINHAETHRKQPTILSQRIAITHLDHATELMMKSFLMKNNINYENLGFPQIYEKCFNFITNNANLPDKQIILEFHTLRNKIQHKPSEIKDINKEEKMMHFRPELKKFYECMFPDEWEYDTFVKDGRIYKGKFYKRKIRFH